jgi:hypothetical protein
MEHIWSILVGKPLGKRALERPMRRWVGNIKMYRREVGCEDGRWMQLAQDHVNWWVFVLLLLNNSGSATTMLNA